MRAQVLHSYGNPKGKYISVRPSPRQQSAVRFPSLNICTHSEFVPHITILLFAFLSHWPPSLHLDQIFFPADKVMPDKDVICDLFRFLQLLCEGHNSGYFPNMHHTDLFTLDIT